jgi:hypothetical protein
MAMTWEREEILLGVWKLDPIKDAHKVSYHHASP